VSDDGTPNLLLTNDGKGHFKDVAIQCGVGFDQSGMAAGSMGASVGDCNGDGLPDLLVTRLALPLSRICAAAAYSVWITMGGWTFF
jgi:hypothetical protein